MLCGDLRASGSPGDSDGSVAGHEISHFKEQGLGLGLCVKDKGQLNLSPSSEDSARLTAGNFQRHRMHPTKWDQRKALDSGLDLTRTLLITYL